MPQMTYVLSGSANPVRFKRDYHKLIGQTFDLKISHKIKIFPNQIKIFAFFKVGIFRKSKHLKNAFGVENTVTGVREFLNYYEINRYYLGRRYYPRGKYIAPWMISSSAKFAWNSIQRRRFVIINEPKQGEK